MRAPYEIVKKPLISEKSQRLNEEANQVTFEVAMDSAFGAKGQTKDGVAEGGGGQTSTTLA